jgi:predicted DsbA family dithiol-disulfide isomerase
MTVTLDVHADPVCPWCLIGKAWLDRALAQRPDHPFVLRWLPFQLNPDLPPEGADRRAYLEAKFGGKAAASAIYARVMDAAAAAGVEIELERIARQPNTRDAHRLIWWAGVEGCQTIVIEALMRAYFSDGADIGAPGVLAGIGAAAGMDRALVLRLLAGSSDLDTIGAAEAQARAMGVQAVPTFVIAGQYVVAGAQRPEFWTRVIDEIAPASRAGRADAPAT